MLDVAESADASENAGSTGSDDVALIRKWIPSPNFSSRGSTPVRLIVLHTAEGARTIEELGAFFAKSSSGVSSHTGVDDKGGTIGEYVKRGDKAWTSAGANSMAVQTELCAFAHWTPAEWGKHPAMLDNLAQWIAEEAAAFDIPITKLTPQQAQGSGRGVCQHRDLGSWGGGHHDCGDGFPIDSVLEQAKSYAEGGEPATMGYPDWFWDWANWYLTTSRDPDHRPPAAPQNIPGWAWAGNQEIDRVARRYGMTSGERDWIDWYLAGKHGQRPDVPQTIPERWWDDERWALER